MLPLAIRPRMADISDPAVRKRFLAAGAEPFSSKPGELQKNIINKLRQVKKIIEIAGVK